MRYTYILCVSVAACLSWPVVWSATAYAELGDQLFKLLPDDGAAGDRFGRSVAISGNTVIVGAYLDDDNGSQSGSAYLFDTTTGEQIAKLLPDDGAAGDQFGGSVAISGTTAIVGLLVTTTTATTLALPISSTPPQAGRSPSSCPTTVRAASPSASPSGSVAPSPSSGPTATTRTAPTPARHTSLMLLPARGILMTTQLSACLICSRCWEVGARVRRREIAPPTSTTAATLVLRICWSCWARGGRVREEGGLRVEA